MIWVFLAPFLLAPLLPLLDRWLGNRAGWLIACVPIAIGAYFALLGRGLPGGADRASDAWGWAPSLGLQLTLMLDGLSLLFVLLITAVGAVVAIYASGYLAGHERLGRFHAYMMLFMGAMLGIVLAGNLLTLYVCWELTSLASFLLIGFERERSEARAAATQALLTTAAGGLCLLAGFVLLGLAAGSFELTDVLARGDAVREHRFYPAIVALVLIGAMTKSAQFPFHYWLPSAMEAPTPVSAYLHSATMVKAGIYMIARLTPVLGGTDLWSVSLTSVGAVTMFLGAYVAFFKNDLKAVLAYLTINVLGTLTMLLGLGTQLAVKAAMVYMIAHAMYKGALFLIAGIVDHATDSRDLRELRGLFRSLPLTGVMAAAAALSMAGVAPTFGFVAKETFLDAAWHAPFAAYVVTAVSVVSSILLAVGAGRVAIAPFFGRPGRHAAEAHPPSFAMQLAPLILATGGVVVGLAPQTLMGPLLESAVPPITGEPAKTSLALWHGINVPLVLSLLVLAAGVACYVLRDALQQRLIGTIEAARWGPERWYAGLFSGLNRFASWQTRILQPGQLPRYVFVVTLVLLVLVVWELVLRGGIREEFELADVRPHEALIALLVPAAALAAVRFRSRLASIAALGVVGYGVAWLFAIFGAPDLAATQIVVETLTVILFVLAFARLPRFTRASSRRTRIRDALLAGAVGLALTMLLLHATHEPHAPPISEWYVRHSVSEAHGRNIVNVILVDFRALDTLGEITVLAVAAAGVWALVRWNGGTPLQREEQS